MKKTGTRLAGLALALIIAATVACDAYDVKIDYPPVIELIKPSNGQVFNVGDSIAFQCSAGDPGHGALDGDLVVWESDIQGGEIGRGQKFGRKDLNPGLHTITITATDSAGNWSTLDFSITVQ